MKPVSLPPDLKAVLLTGAAGAAAGFITQQAAANVAPSLVVVVGASARAAEETAEDARLFCRLFGKPEPPSLPFPEAPEDPDDPRQFETECDRIATLTQLHERLNGRLPGPPPLLFTTPKALLQPCPPPKGLAAHELRLQPGQTLAIKDFTDRLANDFGYDSEAVCETPGQYAVRGGLVDVYPLNANAPCRVDFFGDEIESLREFDPTTQRSGERLPSIIITGSAKKLGTAGAGSFASYLPPASVLWIMLEPAKQTERFAHAFEEPENFASPQPSFGSLLRARDRVGDTWLGLSELDIETAFFEHAERLALKAQPLAVQHEPMVGQLGHHRVELEQAARLKFLRELARMQASGDDVLMLSRNPGERDRLREIVESEASLRPLRPRWEQGVLGGQSFRLELPEGTEPFPLTWPLATDKRAIVVVTEGEIFSRNRHRILPTRRRKLPQRSHIDQLLDFSELADGDHLVHLQHGICIYRGIRKMELKKRLEEVVSLEFDEGVILHLPLYESHLLSRYVGLAKVHPKLGKVGGSGWEKTRQAAERATLDLAADLLEVQARRTLRPGFAFPPDQPWLREFEKAFPYTETPDQLSAIQHTKGDMETPRPMDRLLCGDVGFGKTEVALRAAFKAVLGGKQVAVMVPTTVLAQQHFNTFRERLADYPVVVEMLSRFRTPKQREQIQDQLARGKIDIVVGTHALLGKDVTFKDLGLLVIDEEHRFGVKQKERLKHMRETVDVLAMSATPIPRTLYFALMGARDLSVIETPPRDRLPIQTLVKTYSPDLVRDAIRFELARGGQVFYLHNRVDTIETVAQRLRDLVPEATVEVGHGQMDGNQLERVMTRYVAGEFQVLVCTTVIESGLDIPNCNTLIIEGADRFGLSQLYQLRGRVGRFNRQAYAYLLLHRHGRLLDQAHKRLAAMRQHNQLGAGFRIAMRDLELRGAGNLLGSKQSGHIAGVGFDLYCQLLRQSIARLKGEKIAASIRASLRLDFAVVGEVTDDDKTPTTAQEATTDTPIGYEALKEDELARHRGPMLEAYLPSAYINETRLRIDFYRRLAMADSPKVVTEVAEALKDRFGKPPAPVEALLRMTEIRCIAEQKGIVCVETEGNRLKCQLARPGNPTYVKIGERFPRLTARQPLLRLREIKNFLTNLESPGT